VPPLKLIADGGAARGTPDTIAITGDRVTAVSPEGEVRSSTLGELIERIAPPRIDTCGTVLPDGVKCVIPIPRGSIFVHQSAPRVHSFEWIDPSSPAPCGQGTRYRKVRLALPYLIVLAVFDEVPGEAPRLAGSSECFFSNRPLDHDGVETRLLFPALLNCSRFPGGDPSKPLSWICVQHLRRMGIAGELATGAAIRAWLTALLRHLLESGFNLSSEQHEGSSWFSETVAAGVDARVSSVEAWEQATVEDPLFALEVPWLPTGRTLAQIAERIAAARGRRRARLESARDLMRAVFQTQKSARRTR